MTARKNIVSSGIGLFLITCASVTATVPSDHPVTGTATAGYIPAGYTIADHPDYLAEILEICQYLDAWQVKDTMDPEFGGMIEDEFRTGEDRIVQTDNTQEAIFVWSRYYNLTGDDQFRSNIDDAWTYVMNFPAYEEESEYYRVWNCGWGLRCAMEHGDAFPNDARETYAALCAQYIADNSAALEFFNTTPPGVGIRNALTVSWAVWNLYHYAERAQDSDLLDTAAVEAERVKTWVEDDPDNIAKVSWALSGGLAAACVLDNLFHDDPDGAAAWRDTHLVNLVIFHDPEEFPEGAWIHAWDSWQALAQNVLWQITGDFSYRVTALEITDYIRSQDGDDDGGIPPNPNSPDDEDETWVSTYIVLTGMGDLQESPRLLITMDDTDLQAGDRFEAVIDVYNPGQKQDVVLYVALQFGTAYYFWPSFSETPPFIPLSLDVGSKLSDLTGTNGISILTIDPWPEGVGALDAAWIGALLDSGSMELVGDIVTLPWSAS